MLDKDKLDKFIKENFTDEEIKGLQKKVVEQSMLDKQTPQEPELVLFAIDKTTGQRLEVLQVEIYQGMVLYLETMDEDGDIKQWEEPVNFEYKMIK